MYIGTSGYSYQDWIPEVYPEGTPKKDFFKYYATLFLFSELNFSYYTMPTGRSLKPLAEKAPPGFLFSIKAHQSLTHAREPGWEEEAKRFLEGIESLRDSDKLATVLFQFPFSFHYTKENRYYLDSVARAFTGAPVHVEFRNSEWNNEAVLQGLRDRGVGYIASDNPGLSGLPQFLPEVTGDTGYVRFHGRNSENWWKGTNTTRYDYLYSGEEIGGRIPELMKMAEKSKVLLVAFNNHYKGKAVKNGKELIEKLTGIPGLTLVLPGAA